MEPAQSGRARAAGAVGHAEALEAQARELLHRAERARTTAARISRGNDGEQIIGNLLEQLRPHGWMVLHDRRRQPGSPANLDHVLIGPPGVFVIDAKNWTGGRLRLDPRGMAVGRWRKDDELHAAKVDADIVGAHVRAVVPDGRTVGVLAFVHDMGLTGPARHQQVLLMQQEHLLAALHPSPTLLTPQQVADLTAVLEAHLPPRLPSARRPASQAAASAAPASAVVALPDAGLASTRGAAVGPAPRPPMSPAQRRKDKERNKARQQLRSAAVTLALVAVAIPTAPWVIGHVVKAVTPTIIAHLVPPARSPAPAPDRPTTR